MAIHTETTRLSQDQWWLVQRLEAVRYIRAHNQRCRQKRPAAEEVRSVGAG